MGSGGRCHGAGPKRLAEPVGEGARQPHRCLQLRGVARGGRSSTAGGKEWAEMEVALNLLWLWGDREALGTSHHRPICSAWEPWRGEKHLQGQGRVPKSLPGLPRCLLVLPELSPTPGTFPFPFLVVPITSPPCCGERGGGNLLSVALSSCLPRARTHSHLHRQPLWTAVSPRRACGRRPPLLN